jgi:YidC/Oxa1 family membrane protein insertase
MLVASSIGQIFHPFYIAFAEVLSFFYELVPNYAVAIALLTVAVMIVVFPVTLKGTRGMIKMQLLAPELKIIQNRHKPKPGMSVEERQAARQRLNEEMMALYKENNANPAGGCVPMFLQLPVFVVLYGTIRGLIHTSKVHGVVTPTPLYVSHTSRLYNDIIHGGGHLRAFGIDLADSVKSVGSWGHKAPFIILILIAIALQYIQMKQMSGRNPAAAAANPQMQTMQRVMPLIFAVIYISIPAGVNVYFIVSSLFRIAQQDGMYRWDPSLQAAMERLRKNAPALPAAPPTAGAGGLRARFREAARGAMGSANGVVAESSNGTVPKGNGASPKGAAFTPPRVQQQTNRAKNKKPRRSR